MQEVCKTIRIFELSLDTGLAKPIFCKIHWYGKLKAEVIKTSAVSFKKLHSGRWHRNLGNSGSAIIKGKPGKVNVVGFNVEDLIIIWGSQIHHQAIKIIIQMMQGYHPLHWQSNTKRSLEIDALYWKIHAQPYSKPKLRIWYVKICL